MSSYNLCNKLDNSEFIGLRVKVIHISKNKYIGLLNAEGTVTKAGSTLGVRLDGHYNSASKDGTFWFKKHEVRSIDEYCLAKKKEEKEMKKMRNLEGYNFVATVILYEDKEEKDYQFALYTDDYLSLRRKDNEVVRGQLVVVNPRTPENRALGRIWSVVPVEDYNGVKPQAEVVGVVMMDRFNAELEEAARRSEILKIQKALDEEIDKLAQSMKTADYYQNIVSSITDGSGNDKIQELVSQLRSLEVKSNA